MDDRIDYAAFRVMAYDDDEQIYDESISLANNLKHLFTSSVIMPNQGIQLPILLSYMLTPSAMSDILPIAFLQGDKGSGKSTAATLASHLHNSKIQAASTTFAALRNHVNMMRWEDAMYCYGERNYMLIWDNINRMTLDNEQIYTLLLCGYDRKTDCMMISAGSGSNQEFRVFGPKMMSTIHPLFVSSNFAELNRRLMVFKFKQWENFTSSDLNGSPSDFDFDSRLDFSAVDLSPLKLHFDRFWSEPRHLSEYATVKKKLKRRTKSFKMPESMDSHKWTISVDILTTGIVTGVFQDLQAGLDAIGSYWEWYKDNILESWGATHKLLQAAIIELTETTQKVNEQAGREVIPVEIKPKEIKMRINAAYQEGALDIIPNPQAIANLMQDLGFKLDRSSDGKGNAWIPIR